MIITKPKAEFLYEGETYRIGDTVVACWESEYAGLIGRIDEIRTGKVEMFYGEKFESVNA